MLCQDCGGFPINCAHTDTCRPAQCENCQRFFAVPENVDIDALDLGARVIELAQENMVLRAENSAKAAHVTRLLEALTPSAGTKAAYMGEVVLETVSDDDEDGLPVSVKRHVPWTAIKDVMALIRKRADP